MKKMKTIMCRLALVAMAVFASAPTPLALPAQELTL